MSFCPRCKANHDGSRLDCQECGTVFDEYIQERKECFQEAVNVFNEGKSDSAKELFVNVAKEYPETRDNVEKYFHQMNTTYLEARGETNKQSPAVKIPKTDRQKKPRYAITSASDGSAKPVSIQILEIIAWVNLIGGLLGAFFSWRTMGTIKLPSSLSLYGAKESLEQIYLAMGFACLIEGIIGSAFLFVFCNIAANLVEIRKTNKIIAEKQSA